MRSNQRSEASFTTTARRDQLVQAAVQVLSDDGYARTSIAAIADYVGVSKGVVSYHFADKADLLQGVVDRILGEAGRWMADRVAGAQSYTEALHRYIGANLSYLQQHRSAAVALTEVLLNARTVDRLSSVWDRAQTTAISELEQLFVGGQRAGEFGPVPARTLAISLRATIDAASTLARHDPDFDFERFGSELTELYDRAISGGGSSADAGK